MKIREGAEAILDDLLQVWDQDADVAKLTALGMTEADAERSSVWAQRAVAKAYALVQNGVTK